MLLTEKHAHAICTQVLGYIQGAEAEVTVLSEDLSHQRFAANSFTTCGRREDLTVTVSVTLERKQGSASTNELTDESLKAAVSQAEQLARLAPVNPEYMRPLGPQKYKPSAGYSEATAAFSVADRAKAMSDIIGACEKAGVIGAGFHSVTASATGSANKSGNFYYGRSSLVGLSVTARTPDGTGSGYFSRDHFDVAKLDLARIGRAAISKAIESKNPRTLDPGVYPVILEPQAVADLAYRFDFDARSADEGRSPFSAPGGKTKVGERIMDERLNLYSDPWHPESPGSGMVSTGVSVDKLYQVRNGVLDSGMPSTGVPAEKLYQVRNGVLENLSYSRWWAQQKGKEPSPGPVNTILESSSSPATLEEMIKRTERGLLISRFWYIRSVDPRTLLLTGLTRDGMWFIEEGRIRFPVHNFRFNQSVLELLAPGNVEMIGASERVSDGYVMPTLKVKQFHFTSQSDAV